MLHERWETADLHSEKNKSKSIKYECSICSTSQMDMKNGLTTLLCFKPLGGELLSELSPLEGDRDQQMNSSKNSSNQINWNLKQNYNTTNKHY